ncbi:sortase-associated OmpA-like protein PdsO [Alteromonas facilis]|uniref:sortase-associated OmpA-like protein PdsO n=1 Tax=Alteromonas facilis TaxID=2048004 RepID=UPI000C293501|nr:sortase-associated OmpA-like protein PdsO [Alteromonas facilis]
MKNTQRIFKQTAIATLVVMATSQSVFAANQTDEVNESPKVLVGGATGAAMGGIAAGPIGAVVGGIIGLMIGNDSVQNEKLTQSELALADKTEALNAMQSELFAWQQKAMLQPVNEVQAVEPLLPELTTSIQFKTGTADIQPVYAEQLNLISELLNSTDGLAVHIMGYADPRGSAKDNLALSEHRARAVQQALIAEGVGQDKISFTAMGEKQSETEPSMESYFFDRKAVLMIAPTQKILTAKQ